MAMNRRGLTVIIVAVLVASGVAALRFWPEGESKASEKPRLLVSTTTARAIDLPIRLASQGHLVPINQVDVRPQVTARIHRIHFKEGEDVRAGQLLFTLDDAELTAQLNRARAQATQIKVQLEDAQRALNRGNELVSTNYISSSALDTLAANVKTFEAQRRAALADVEAARVQLAYTVITAPISAKAGELKLREGSIVQTGDSTPLVSLLQFDPIAAEFTLPEQYLETVLKAQASGEVRVSVDLPGSEALDGELIFINNAVNTSTGTIHLKARFPNPGHRLWPGAFVRIDLQAGQDPGVIVLPPQAVLEGPDGHFVYTLDAEGRAQPQAVTLLRVQDQNAVVSGIDNGERVVVEGNQNLRKGMEVREADTDRGDGGQHP